MRNTFKVLFYIKRNELLKSGKAAIMCRITINGERAHLATQQSVEPALWVVGLGRVRGHSAQATQINEVLERISLRIRSCYEALCLRNPAPTPQLVKESFCGDGRSSEQLLAFFNRHNAEFAEMVGVSRSRSTYYKYRCVFLHLGRYIREHYQLPDLPFAKVDRSFLIGFHRYLKEHSHKKNTIWVYLIALKHILTLARNSGFLPLDPFAGYKLRSEFVPRNHLTAEELKSLIALTIHEPHLQLVRDAFVFSCFTGLSYIDLRELRSSHIQLVDKQLWINTKRHKTGTEVSVRLFDITSSILDRYRTDNPQERIFGLPCNWICNLRLAQIFARLQIPRRITFHAARHTFATTITLSEGMPIETISTLLGHKSIRTTQIYAAVTHAKIGNDLQRLSKVIDSRFHTFSC